MKKILVALVTMCGIIVVRMILSVTLTEQVAEVFSRISIGILFYYFICTAISSRSKKA